MCKNFLTMNIGFSPALSSSPKFKTSGCGNEVADEAFQWLLSPSHCDRFFLQSYEKYPLHLKRHIDHYKGLFSTKVFDKIITENDLSYDLLCGGNIKKEIQLGCEIHKLTMFN
ncbi:hypothetical protein TNCV_2172701 [Trichonephila clavipes]|nr:hypothetical protein TNCV_2172701 [Trichonephila clavipes]